MTTFFSFCNLIKKPIHKSSSKSADMGTAIPMMSRLVPGQTAEEVERGIRTRNTVKTPWSKTNFVLPLPLKYPSMQKLMAVSKYSKEQLFRYSWVEAINFRVIGKDRCQKIPLQECQQEYHNPQQKEILTATKNAFVAPADVVCPNVLRNESGKGRHETHRYQRQENKKIFPQCQRWRKQQPPES